MTVQTGTLCVVIWFMFYVNIIQGEPDWIVSEKVLGYGDNLILFCLIDDCCTKAAGWIKFDPDYKTIFLDVRDSKNDTHKDNYTAKTNSTGFSLVIKNLHKEDTNIKYSCVYGFVRSRAKYLLLSDAFRDDQTKSEIPEAVIIIGLLIALVILVAAVVLFRKFKQNRSRKKRTDIVIIHVDYRREDIDVRTFKDHLEQLSNRMGYSAINIKLLYEVFPRDLLSSVVKIKTVLKKCNYVFVYISDNFCLDIERKFGLNACLIDNALEKQKNNKHIKIVLGGGSWNMPGNKSMTVFLDYYQYKKSDDFINNTYKEKFKDLLKIIHTP